MSGPAHASTKRDEPIRIFKSDFLEFFSHISPLVVLIVWLPLSAFFLAWSINESVAGTFPVHIPLAFLGGIVLWTLLEYVLHRFLFHYHPKTELGKRINFMFHGVHHAQPMVKTRLVMPPAISLPLGAMVYGLIALVAGLAFGAWHIVKPLAAGAFFGYLLYDMTHYSTHHFNFKFKWFHWVRSHHMKHHVQTPAMRFGVTSPLWDVVFGTEPENSPANKSTKKE